MDEAVILTQSMVVDGRAVKLSFAPEDNTQTMQEVKEILLSSLENPHNLQLFSEGGVTDERAV